jgi:L-arabinose isomerase
MSGKRIPEVQSKFPAINSLREIIRKENERKKAEKDAEEFVLELHKIREKEGYEHMTITFETGEGLRVESGFGCELVEPIKERRELSFDRDCMILSELSAKKVVGYYVKGW